MIVVIQCAGRKNSTAGNLMQSDGRKVMFVGNPNMITSEGRDDSLVYAHPDDMADTGQTWRDELSRYNAEESENPYGLLPAWQLYRNPTYALLEATFGTSNLYILSAGWGLISASFLTPNYDITFSTNNVEKYKQRNPKDDYNDFNMLFPNIREPVVFFVCLDYVPLASQMIKKVEAPCYLFQRSQQTKTAPNFITKHYETSTKTNWHYACAKDFVKGRIGI